MTLLNWFDKGLTIEEYSNGMQVNQKEMNTIYDRFELHSSELEQLEGLKSKNYKVIALTEDWCGDAMVNNPILLKIAEACNFDVRFLLRDQNLELMDQYLTNGTSRAIPIYIFLDNEGKEKAVWGPRADKIQQLVQSLRSELPEADAPEFKEQQMAMYKKLTTAFQEDESLWHEVAVSIINKLTTTNN
ncbi:thioredoxin family protein [Bacillus sp. 31A1R]|uniref:Thioredoxin family protein n=1 Tax=Robertmurraya mangrovi TaxID=3098077 RepID=A0ABU5J2M6_9BACI|nr:thioredoxin family protein [Bacillus sp. 31A1R]MDZ5473612.1 thioredoxin family protein [Bacillus sp. 31A1R]